MAARRSLLRVADAGMLIAAPLGPDSVVVVADSGRLRSRSGPALNSWFAREARLGERDDLALGGRPHDCRKGRKRPEKADDR